MRFSKSSTLALATALGAASALGLALISPVANAAPHRPAPDSQVSARQTAESALAAVQAALDGDGARSFGAPKPSRDLSLLLNDLAIHVDALSAADQRTAQRYLARPDNGGDSLPGVTVDYGSATVRNTCSADVCINWIETGPHAPSLTDSNSNNIPDYIESVRTSMQHVWDVEVDGMGYKAPLPDGGRGPNNKLDVYIGDIGGAGYYGYCTSEKANGDGWDYFGYCVLDDDYSPSEFGTANTPLENIQVTAAHEFFHAVQYAYDAADDGWFMEGTAAWMEDEVYDAVNDNRQYLLSSPLSSPSRPLDHSNSIGVYGSWIWWRYLSETYGRGIVKQIWNRADDATNVAGNRYSMRAVDNELASRGLPLTKVFSAFGAANRAPGRAYEEGAAYPKAGAAKSFTLSSGSKSTGSKSLRLNHMGNATIVATPGSGLDGGAWRLKVKVDGPAKSHSPYARVVSYGTDGSKSTKIVKLNKSGAGDVKVGFGGSNVDRVDLVLTNGGHAYGNCFNAGTQYSCMGNPKDDDLKFGYTLTAVK